MSKESAITLQPSFCDRYKWWLLFMMSLAKFQSFLNVSSLSTLQLQFQREIGIDELQFSRMVQLQGVPGLFLPIVMGLLADFYGAWVSVGTSIIAGILGQILICLGISTSSYWCITIGFVIEFAGMDLGNLGYNLIVRAWYKDNELSRTNGILAIVLTVSVLVGNILYPSLYASSESLLLPYLVGLGIAVISGVLGVGMLLMHKKMLNDRHVNSPTNETNEERRKPFSLKFIKSLPRIYWLVVTSFSLGLMSYVASMVYESKLLQTKFNYSLTAAGVSLSIGLVSSAIFNPLLGFWMDKAGRLPLFMIGGLLFTNLGVAANILLPSCDGCFLPVIPLVAMSIASGTVGIVIASMVMRLVDPKFLGAAFALSSMTFSISNITIPWLDGYIAGKTYDEYGYQWVFTVNVCFGTIALILTVILQIADWRGQQKLQHAMSGARRTFSVITPVFEELSSNLLIPEQSSEMTEDNSVIVALEKPLQSA